MVAVLHRQLHGYRSGHQLLHTTMRIQRKDQDLVDQLSDMAGPLRPGEEFSPYISGYSLPSSEYYVLARTSQDHAAPRAGCVTTNSLLVPRTYWEREANPAELVELLERPVKEAALPVQPHARDCNVEPVSSPLLSELVEALFVKKRRPIVVFDAANPILISVRLLTAFWPAMRGEFSLCTFALSPRTLAGKPFDLVFAPDTAQSRFSDWEGRRIGPSAKTTGGHHRWAEQIRASVFQEEKPTLFPLRYARALGGLDHGGDEAFLRLLMLWGDLEEKASSSPMAVLGLVDIAKSRGALKGELLVPEICNAMEVATKELEASEAWSFLGTLMEKLKGSELSPAVCRVLRSVVARLVQRKWIAALEFLVEQHVQSDAVSNKMLAEETAGRLAIVGAPELRDCLELVPAVTLVQVLLLHDDLLELALAGVPEERASYLVNRITVGLRGQSGQARAASAMRLLAHVQGDHHSALVVEVVRDMTAERLIRAVELVWGERGIRGAKLGDAFCAAAREKDANRGARAVFASVDGDEDTDRCIVRLLEPSSGDMKWVLDSTMLGDRRARLLGTFVEEASQEELNAAFGEPDVAGDTLDLFMKEVGNYGNTAARIIVLPSFAREEQVQRGLELYDYLVSPERDMVGQCIAIGALADGEERNTSEIEDVLGVVLPDIDELKLVDEAFGVNRNGATVSRLLQKFEEFTAQARSFVERNAERIVKSITSRDEFDLTTGGVLSLVRMVERAKSRGADTHAQICWRILPFAMAARDRPASPVIVASFPTVHSRLEGERGSLALMHLFTLVDWDKARTLRRNLVRAYMNSDWPPEDLAIAGLNAKVLGKVLKRVAKEPGGRDFLKRIEKGVRPLEKNVQSEIVRIVKEVRRKRSFVFESET